LGGKTREVFGIACLGLLLAAVMVSPLLASSAMPASSDVPVIDRQIKLSFVSLKVNYGDYVAMFVSPPVINVSAYAKALNVSETYDMHVIEDYPGFMNTSTLVVMIPHGSGTYDLTVSFFSKGPFEVQYGVVTSNYTAYQHLAAAPYSLASGVWFLPVFVSSYADNGTFYNASAQVTVLPKSGSGSGGLPIRIPPFVPLLTLMVISVLLAYIDVFAVYDTYWKSKAEEVSRKRWVGLVLLVIFSVILLYILMVTMGVVMP